MFGNEPSRRALLLGAAALSVTRGASASARPQRGGKLAMRVPFAIRAFDPHWLGDVGSMLMSPALFETLYRTTPEGFEPVLAEGMPTTHAKGLHVPLRQGLLTARGRRLDAGHVLTSLERARRSSGRFVLHGIPTPTLTMSETSYEGVRESKSGLVFAIKDEARLLSALASPLTAIVGPSFTPTAPDGTGPFLAERSGDDTWTLRRNIRAAAGPSLLDTVQVRRAATLSDSLRAFETGEDQIAWHGLGLHDARPGARAFDAGAAGVLALAVGRDATARDVPGVAQQLCDALPPQRLAHLNLGSWSNIGAPAWTGPAGQLLVEADSAYLREVAETVAALVSNPGHEITVRALPANELADRLRTRAFLLALTVVRPLWPTPLGSYGALLSLSDPEHAASSLTRPPKVQNARTMTRSLRVGMLGEVRWRGGVAAEVQLPLTPGGLDLGAASFTRRRK